MIQSINGPMNIVRLSGKDKILYLFFDLHEDISNQTECNTNDSIDIVNLFHNSFSKLKEPIDVFIEASPFVFIDSDIIENIKKENYIESLQKWVARNFNYDKNRDKVMQSSTYPFVRFHYFDFRKYFECLEYKDIDINTFISKFTTNVKELEKNLTNAQSKNKKQTLTTDTKNKTVKERFFYKILNNYNNQKIKNKIKKYTTSIFIPFIKKCINYVYEKFPEINKAIEIYEEPTNKLGKRGYGLDYETVKQSSTFIDIFAHKIVNMWLDIFVYLVDIYFIRRFLDKSYIKKGVLYAGAFHCINIILILVKYFDFEITHVFYSSTSINKLNKIIKNLPSDDPYDLIEYLWAPYLFQCSNMKNFPEFT
jgi:hypothetical protein